MLTFFVFYRLCANAMAKNGVIYRLCANAIAIYSAFGKVKNFAKGENGILWRLCANTITINGIIYRLCANVMAKNDIKNSPSVQRIEPKGSFD